MSDNLLAYFDDTRGAVVVRLESGSEVAVLDPAEAESLGEEILAAAQGRSTGYEEFLAQEGAPGYESYLDPATGTGTPPQDCPSCEQPRPHAIGRNAFLPGSTCPRCGHLEPDIEVEQGAYLITLADGGDITVTDEHGNTVDAYRIDTAHEANDWDSYARTLGVTRADVQAALDAQAAEEEEATPGACILTADNLATEDDCTTHGHERT